MPAIVSCLVKSAETDSSNGLQFDENADSPDRNILWTINYDRFNREFRDQARLHFILPTFIMEVNFFNVSLVSGFDVGSNF
jgi:hypothetical protein